MTTETAAKPYATLGEKVKLFQENGIEVLKHYTGGTDYKFQVIHIPGDLETLQTSIKFATENDIRIYLVNLCQRYDGDNQPYDDMYYELVLP